MRTTLNVDDDVLAAARQRARRDGVSIGDALSALARLGLELEHPRPRRRRVRNGIPLLPSAGKDVGPELVDEILDEIS